MANYRYKMHLDYIVCSVHEEALEVVVESGRCSAAVEHVDADGSDRCKLQIFRVSKFQRLIERGLKLPLFCLI